MQSFSKPFDLNRLSRHAQVRMQQRSIPNDVICLLLELTDPVPAGSGYVLHRFNGATLAEAQRYVGENPTRLERYRNAYIVVADDGTVVTAARLH